MASESYFLGLIAGVLTDIGGIIAYRYGLHFC